MFLCVYTVYLLGDGSAGLDDSKPKSLHLKEPAEGSWAKA